MGSLQIGSTLGTIRNRLGRVLARLTPNDQQRLLTLTIVSGGLCGLVAVSFHVGIEAAAKLMIDRATQAANLSWIFWTILTPAIGALVVGLALYYWVPGAVGSGVPQVKLAYARYAGRIPFRDAIGKFVLGIVQIGSGASLGREGPTVQICAGVSSWLARLASLSQQSQRRLSAVGVAAGIAAAFNAPIAAVTFTVEEVIGDLDQTMLSGVIIAAAIAAAVERSILGQNPVFEIHQAHTLGHATSLVSYAVLGLLSAVASVAFTDSLLSLRAWFKGLTVIPTWAHPAIGGAATGVLAALALGWLKQGGIAGGGYPTLATALTGSLPAKVMIGLCALKLAATVCSYASGGAGGIFAPALFIGGMLGGAIGYVDVNVFHHAEDSIGAFALVGMGAVFAGIIRAPITSVVIIFEMTGSYGLILPLMIANMSGYGLARYWRPVPIYEALLLQDGVVLPHGRAITPENPEAEEPGELPP
jgi:CIC family chloride channel protein